MAVPAMIGWHDSAALYRGLADTFESFEPALRRLGCTTHLGDAPGLASPHDITLLGATYG